MMSDLSGGGVDRDVKIQKTTYFYGVATNEIGTSRFMVADWMHGRDDDVCSIFEDYVASGDRLTPLSESALSNHIGVTTLVITSDDCVVLQKQGTTLVDVGKITAGASGSVDWKDVRRSAGRVDGETGESRKTLQGIVSYAMEREASEEIGVTVGPGASRTTLTGFARYLHRAGKPEFFAITYVRQRYDDIPRSIRTTERKWVRQKIRRKIEENGLPGLQAELRRMDAEFREAGTGSVSLIKAIDCAERFLSRPGVDLAELRP
jgi:hypothetical protein